MVRPVIRVPYTEDGLTRGTAAFGAHAASSGQLGHPMSKVPSLMFDMEDTEETPSSGAAARSEPPEGDVVHKVTSLLAPWDEDEYMLALHVRIAREDAAKRGQSHLSVAELADTLRKLGYPVKLRTALGGGWGGSCLRNLRHSYLAVTLAGDGSGPAAQTVLVDPRFKEQFEIAHTTPRYTRILESLPAEAVAPPDRVSRAVEELCEEMAAAFAESGTPLPPWRQTAAMLSKWQPRRSEEVDVGRDGHALDAALNNAAGGAPTGRSTVAQKLAMLGIEPAQASPISEGADEGLDTWSTATDDPPSSPNDDVSLSFTPPDSGGSPAAAPLPGRAVTATVEAFEAAARPFAKQKIWEGIKEVVATLPTRRATWA